MKSIQKFLLLFLVVGFSSIIPSQQAQSQDPIIEAGKELGKRVIRAVDLQIQRFQNNTIDLQNIQKQIENTLSKLKLDEIANWTKKQKELYQDYFDELWRVKSIIAYYKRIHGIINQQKQLMQEYKRAYEMVRQDDNFSASEIDYMHKVYTGIITQSLGTLDQLLTIVQSFTLQMSDAERLALINRCSDEIDTYLTDCRKFTDGNISLSLQRGKEKGDLLTVRKLYGLD